MDFFNSFFNSLTQTQQILAIVVIALLAFVVGTFIYKYFTNKNNANISPSPSGHGHGHDDHDGYHGHPRPYIASYDGRGDPNHVTPLSEESVNLVPAVYAMFYTDWCGYCKQTHPAWEEVMRNMNGYKGVQIVKINCEENPELAKKHNVASYPTIKLLKGGIEDCDDVILYQGDRSAQDLATFLETNL